MSCTHLAQDDSSDVRFGATDSFPRPTQMTAFHPGRTFPSLRSVVQLNRRSWPARDIGRVSLLTLLLPFPDVTSACPRPPSAVRHSHCKNKDGACRGEQRHTYLLQVSTEAAAREVVDCIVQHCF